MGKFIVFEGMDRSGKSTTLKMLGDYLRNNRSFNVNEVTTDTIIGNYIPSLISYTPDEIVYMLFWQAIREIDICKVKPILEKDASIVLCDRHFLSNIAYDWWSDLDIDFKQKVDDLYLNYCTKPDLLFLFTIPYSTFLERDDYDTIFNQSLFESIQQGYLALAEELSDKDICNIVLVDGSLPQDQVFDIVLNKVEEVLD